MSKSVEECVAAAEKKGSPFRDVGLLESLREDVDKEIAIVRGMNEIVYRKRAAVCRTRKEEIDRLTWERDAYSEEIAFSQQWLDSRIAKPEFAKSRKRRAAMKAEKEKRASKGEKRNA